MCASDCVELDELEHQERLELIRERHSLRTLGEPIEWEESEVNQERNSADDWR